MSATASNRISRLLAALLVVGAALFVIGVVTERRAVHREASAAVAASGQETGNEAAEGAATSVAAKAAAAETGNEAAEGAAATTTSHVETAVERAANGETSATGETGERLLGVNVESTPLVVLASIVALALAVAVVRWPRRVVFVVVAALAALWAVADVAEVVHQHREGRNGVAALAGAIAAVHVVIGALALAQAARAQRALAPLAAAS